MSISRQQFLALFTVSIFFWVAFQAWLAMLPVYAIRLGADESATGNYLGFAFFMLAVGGITAGWLVQSQPVKIACRGAIYCAPTYRQLRNG